MYVEYLWKINVTNRHYESLGKVNSFIETLYTFVGYIQYIHTDSKLLHVIIRLPVCWFKHRLKQGSHVRMYVMILYQSDTY